MLISKLALILHQIKKLNSIQNMTNALEILAKFEIRPSLQRVAVMDYVLKNKFHSTADEIYDELIKTMPTLSRTTVYNTLNLLTEKGAIRALHLEKDAVHYDAALYPHAHFICSQCRKIHDVDIPEDLWNKVLSYAPVPDAEMHSNFHAT